MIGQDAEVIESLMRTHPGEVNITYRPARRHPWAANIYLKDGAYAEGYGTRLDGALADMLTDLQEARVAYGLTEPTPLT